MLITLRYPLLDLRTLEREPRARRFPAVPWKPRGGFVHGVGPIRARKRGTIPYWSGESTYCDATRALKLRAFPSAALREALGTNSFSGVDRRLYAHRSYLFSVDVSIRVDGPAAATDFRSVVDAFLAESATVYLDGQPVTTSLAKAGRLVASRLASATGDPSDTSIYAGPPLAVIEDAGDGEIKDARLRRVDSVPATVRLYAGDTVGSATTPPVPFWLVRSQPGAPRRAAERERRELRVCLLRTGTELEAISTAASTGAEWAIPQLALETGITLADVAWRGGPAARPMAVLALAAFRRHQPATFEYLAAALATANEKDRIELHGVAWADERDTARQGPNGAAEARAALVANMKRNVRYGAGFEQSLIPSVPYGATYEHPPIAVVQNFFAESRQEFHVNSGDKFENISNATIVSRSSIVNSLNRAAGDPELERAIRDLVEAVQRLEDPAAADITEALVEELTSSRRSRALISTLWDRLREVAPTVAELGTTAAAIGGLLGAG